MKGQPETKSVSLTIRVTPSVKAIAEKRAEQDGRSLANYLARLIEEDADKAKRR